MINLKCCEKLLPKLLENVVIEHDITDILKNFHIYKLDNEGLFWIRFKDKDIAISKFNRGWIFKYLKGKKLLDNDGFKVFLEEKDYLALTYFDTLTGKKINFDKNLEELSNTKFIFDLSILFNKAFKDNFKYIAENSHYMLLPLFLKNKTTILLSKEKLDFEEFNDIELLNKYFNYSKPNISTLIEKIKTEIEIAKILFNPDINNNYLIAFKGISADAIEEMLELDDIIVGSVYSCGREKENSLIYLGIDELTMRTTIRLCACKELNTEEENLFIEKLKETIKRLSVLSNI